ncbi:sugar ABC transporter ATP-binding protein [Feifania hominis]|uniref:Sugar ABC transporter ATP-binding protein n=1 Tax=Feifania hominis TaxID=2763660 RepID=A0A926HV09_9FIRM|nr:sugar ABC transporter ATP-binding protein [Feifania hominis]MBC8536121.1 sugar ABC transporter ATP-binding protein [Feifania hominis]
MGEPFLTLRHISKSFGGVHALTDVSFSIEAGETYCLMGENGSGKSTLIKIISGVYEADEGEIIIGGKSRRKLTPVESIKEGIQIIYQDFSVFPNLSVAENIALSSMVIGKKKLVNRREMRRIASEALARIGVELPLDELVEELPVAGKQIVAIARGIAQDVKLLVMDEPTTALTHKEILALYKIIEALKKKGVSIVFVSHKLEEVFSISEKIAILRNGKKVLDDRIENFDPASLTYHMTGREIPSVPYEYVPQEDGKPILEVEALSMKGAFEDVSFSLLPREILGVTGQLGCGRTELAKALFGIGEKSGKIRLGGEEVKIDSVLDAHRLGIGYVPEDRLSEGLFLTRSLTDNITVAGVDRLAHGIMLDRREFTAEAEKWLAELDINSAGADAPASSLSGGNQQRVVLAKWLATSPKLLILNCPTVGVDVGSKNQIHEIIKDLARRGIGIIVISDDIGEILTLCNRVLLMRDGKVVRQYQSAETTADQLEKDLIQAQ